VNPCFLEHAQSAPLVSDGGAVGFASAAALRGGRRSAAAIMRTAKERPWLALKSSRPTSSARAHPPCASATCIGDARYAAASRSNVRAWSQWCFASIARSRTRTVECAAAIAAVSRSLGVRVFDCLVVLFVACTVQRRALK
jgi:hypothetical protein